MKLSHTILKYSESAECLRRHLREAAIPQRAMFNYANATQDQTPDVLVLGNYTHPSTGNELVGGINLNYLEPHDLKQLQRATPEIMRGGDLQQRYRIGKQVLPDVFDAFYRTYDSAYINQVSPAEMPTRPVPSAPAQPAPAQPAQPAPAQQAPAQQVPAQPARPTPGRMQPAQPQPAQPAPAAQPQQSRMGLARLAQAYRQRMAQWMGQQQAASQAQAQQQAQQNLSRERQKNLADLTAPAQEDPLQTSGEPLPPNPGLESVNYYSPAQGKYITEWVEL